MPTADTYYVVDMCVRNSEYEYCMSETDKEMTIKENIKYYNTHLPHIHYLYGGTTRTSFKK